MKHFLFLLLGAVLVFEAFCQTNNTTLRRCFNLDRHNRNLCPYSQDFSPDLFVGDIDFDNSDNYFAVFAMNSPGGGQDSDAEPSFENWFTDGWLGVEDEGGSDSMERAHCTPQEIGIVLSRKFIENISKLNETMDIITKPPKQAVSYGINHISINWFPNGYPPSSFQVPHFDFSFNFIPQVTRNLILCKNNSTQHYPSTLPSGYSADTCVPKMGYAVVNSTLLSNSDVQLVQDLGYLYYQQRIVSLTLMITASYLLDIANSNSSSIVHYTFNIPAPQATNETKVVLFPQQYSIWYLPRCEQFFISCTNWSALEKAPTPQPPIASDVEQPQNVTTTPPPQNVTTPQQNATIPQTPQPPKQNATTPTPTPKKSPKKERKPKNRGEEEEEIPREEGDWREPRGRGWGPPPYPGGPGFWRGRGWGPRGPGGPFCPPRRLPCGQSCYNPRFEDCDRGVVIPL